MVVEVGLVQMTAKQLGQLQGHLERLPEQLELLLEQLGLLRGLLQSVR